MSSERNLDDKFLHALRILAPGTGLREGIESILRGKMGALIVVSDSPQVMSIIDGGFHLDCEFTPAAIYELAKMDGAIILNRDSKRILWANTQLIPDPSIPSFETGIRHRTAERVARQTGELVIAISQRRGIISLYWGPMKYVLQDIGVLLVKANQALQTLEKYKMVLDKDLITLTAMEFENLVTVFDVAKVIQRMELVMRIVHEIRSYVSELGVEGRLVNLQLEELVGDVEDEVLLIIRDYSAKYGDRSPREIRDSIRRWSSEELTDLVAIGRALGYGSTAGILDLSVSPRGYRMLQKIPRLPMQVIENVVEKFNELPKILRASINELDDVEGIGEVRARAIKSGLKRLQEQAILARHS
ncbi:MAG: DNA integrity scanning protein DisA [Firmicutes bacterium]|nr:DNA integrity scanning protein DisA [Bacillota bacterium]